MKKTIYQKIFLAALIIGTLLRISLSLYGGQAGDACWHLSVSRYIAENKHLPTFEPLGRDAFSRPPLFHILSAILYIMLKPFGLQETGLLLVSPIAGSLSILLLYLIAKKISNEKIAAYAALLFAFFPIHLDMSSVGYVDSLLTFTCLLTIYFALEQKLILTGISQGLTLLTNVNGIFLIPFIIQLVIYNKKEDINTRLKKIFLILLITSIIASPHYIKNYIIFGNPLWPLLNSMFHGIGGYSETLVYYVPNIFDRLLMLPPLLFSTLIEIFGIPAGNYGLLMDRAKTIFIFPILCWIAISGITIFILTQKTKQKIKIPLKTLIISFILLDLIHIFTNAASGGSYARYLLPLLPFFCIILAAKLIEVKNIKKWIFLSLFIIIYSSMILVKVEVSHSYWSKIQYDFKNINKITDKNSKFLTTNICLSYGLNRFSINPTNKTVYNINNQAFLNCHEKGINNIDYIMINKPDTYFTGQQARPKTSDEKLMDSCVEKNKNELKEIYANNTTGTKVYQVIKK